MWLLKKWLVLAGYVRVKNEFASRSPVTTGHSPSEGRGELGISYGGLGLWRTSLALLVCLACVIEARGDEFDERFLDGLRQRRLFVLGEAFSRDRLANGNLSNIDATKLTVERVRNLAEYATNVAPDARDGIVTNARQVVDEFVKQNASNSRTLLVRFQDALTSLAVGELGRLENEVSGSGGEQAKLRLREAARLLEQLEKDVAQLIPVRARKLGAEDEMSLDELNSLANNIRFQQSRTWRNQALSYPPGSDDRVASLALAAEQLEKVLRQLAADDTLMWRVKLDLAICWRLSGKLNEARDLLQAADWEASPIAVQWGMKSEQLRLFLAKQSLAEAENFLKNKRGSDSQRFAEWDFAEMETFVALWQAADQALDTKQSAEWQKKAVAALQQLEESHGPYWRRRGELLLVRSAATNRSDANVDILVRTADSLYLQGQMSEAIAAYEKAANMMNSAQDVELRFGVLYKAALIEQKRNHFLEASKRLRSLSLEAHRLAKSSDAHLLAAWLAAQLVRNDTKYEPFYRELLEEHLTTWPKSASSQQARLWLGAFLESRQDFEPAIAAYCGVDRESKQFGEAFAAITRRWPQMLAALPAKDSKTQQAAMNASDFFYRVLRDESGKWREPWTEVERGAAITFAKICIQFLPAPYIQAEEVLRIALERADVALPAWKSSAQILLVIAIAGQPERSEEANKLLGEITDGPPTQLLELVRSLGALAKTSNHRSRIELAKMQLRVIEKLISQRDKLTDAQRTQLDTWHAEALADGGRREEAVAAYEQLVKRLPNDGEMQERFAMLLSDGPNAASWRRGLDQWRLVASKARPRTPLWYRAKYSVAFTQYKLGDKQSAAQMIRFLAETPPGLDGTTMKTQFMELLKKCEGSGGAAVP